MKMRAAILREQGVNGQVEMAAAFNRAGFSAGVPPSNTMSCSLVYQRVGKKGSTPRVAGKGQKESHQKMSALTCKREPRPINSMM